MPADKDPGRSVRMVAAVHRNGGVVHVRDRARDVRAECGEWSVWKRNGWRIVPVIVTIEDKANAR